ncbi:MAG: EamA family transporter RarD [Sneathiellales bacterium]|nr:EamA family transporter RarD [Sneathiellales bacterium]
MSDHSSRISADSSALAEKNRTTQGFLAALGAFGLWGVFPLYFKLFDGVPSLELMAHRIVWSLVFVGLLLVVTKRFGHLKDVFLDKKILLVFLATTVLIGANWLTFIWAISVERVLEASLGYYINPLVSVVLGMLFLKERLNKWQYSAVGLATIAVIWLTVMAGVLPWVSLVLAFSFGFYGLLRKMVPVESAVGLMVETLLLTPVSIGFILYLMINGMTLGAEGGSHGYDAYFTILLIGTGIVTAVPLILFSVAAQRLKLSTVGLMQYIAPTMHILLAVFVFKEPLTNAQIGAFILIWVGLLVYSIDGFRNRGK